MILKTIDLYYEQIFEKYPTISKSDIKKILLYGWKTFYMNNSRGCDVLLNKNDFWLYCGNMSKNSLTHFNYYKQKLARKIRTLYIQHKVKWDGYYYFGLSKYLYQEYINQNNSKGRKRKNYIFKDIILYKIYDECSIIKNGAVAIFRVPYPMDFGYLLIKKEYKTNKAELIELREPLKFKDVLTNNYKLKF